MTMMSFFSATVLRRLQSWAIPVALGLAAWFITPLPTAATVHTLIRRTGSVASALLAVVVKAYGALVGIYLVAPQNQYLAGLTAYAGAAIFFVAIMPAIAAMFLSLLLSPRVCEIGTVRALAPGHDNDGEQWQPHERKKQQEEDRVRRPLDRPQPSPHEPAHRH